VAFSGRSGFYQVLPGFTGSDLLFFQGIRPCHIFSALNGQFSRFYRVSPGRRCPVSPARRCKNGATCPTNPTAPYLSLKLGRVWVAFGSPSVALQRSFSTHFPNPWVAFGSPLGRPSIERLPDPITPIIHETPHRLTRDFGRERGGTHRASPLRVAREDQQSARPKGKPLRLPPLQIQVSPLLKEGIYTLARPISVTSATSCSSWFIWSNSPSFRSRPSVSEDFGSRQF